LAQKIHVAQFQGRCEIGQQETRADVSKYKVSKKKQLAPTLSVFQFQKHSEIE